MKNPVVLGILIAILIVDLIITIKSGKHGGHAVRRTADIVVTIALIILLTVLLIGELN